MGSAHRTERGGSSATLAWLVACSPLALAWLVDTGPDRFAGTSFVALSGLGWLVVASMPRALGTAGRESSKGLEIAAFSLFLPPIAAAVGLDLAQGASTGRTLTLALGVAVAVLILGDAACRAARDERSARAHALGWFALVAGAPLAFYALEIGGGPFLGRAPLWIEWLARASPLGAAAANARDVTLSLHVSWGLPAVLLVMAGLPSLRTRRSGVEDEP